uniref:Rapsyn myristoylation/linker region N-terminal domain-containing protein n=1 Tax=Dendroctonus ponderosae TaxID=77166 RepID=A0AAR5QG43_DENPD
MQNTAFMSGSNMLIGRFRNFNSIYHRSGPGVSHQLSATRLLASPEGSRHPLESSSHSWPWNGSYSSLHRNTYTEVRTLKSSNCTFGCFQLCRAKVANSIAKRKVEQGMKLYKQHKQQQAVRKWKTSLKALETREDKFSVLGYLYLAYMDWGKYR